MPWMYAVAGLLVGVILGVAISRLMTPEYKNKRTYRKNWIAQSLPWNSSDKS